ncbi:MAG: hypothetical protein M1814_006735 [Vezdaea aestivalis]|nr:MAG: hypothetical protein M1814_006735 [Vezdaea aestivalis]
MSVASHENSFQSYSQDAESDRLIKWVILVGMLLLSVSVFIIGSRAHAKRRMDCGLPPMPYHQWLCTPRELESFIGNGFGSSIRLRYIESRIHARAEQERERQMDPPPAYEGSAPPPPSPPLSAPPPTYVALPIRFPRPPHRQARASTPQLRVPRNFSPVRQTRADRGPESGVVAGPSSIAAPPPAYPASERETW